MQVYQWQNRIHIDDNNGSPFYNYLLLSWWRHWRIYCIGCFISFTFWTWSNGQYCVFIDWAARTTVELWINFGVITYYCNFRDIYFTHSGPHVVSYSLNSNLHLTFNDYFFGSLTATRWPIPYNTSIKGDYLTRNKCRIGIINLLWQRLHAVEWTMPTLVCLLYWEKVRHHAAKTPRLDYWPRYEFWKSNDSINKGFLNT